MNQPITAKQSEAEINVGAINRAQQAYYLEHRGFSNSIEELGLGIQTKTANYDYSAYVKHRGTPKEFKESNEFVLNYAISHKDNLKSYVGIVFVTKAKPVDTIDDEVTMAVVCEAVSSGPTRPIAPILQPVPYPRGAQEAFCSSGTTPVSKY